MNAHAKTHTIEALLDGCLEKREKRGRGDVLMRRGTSSTRYEYLNSCNRDR